MILISIVLNALYSIDEYLLGVVLPDLAGHEHSPAAFLIYVVLWTQTL
jgi:hypothetical protein